MLNTPLKNSEIQDSRKKIEQEYGISQNDIQKLISGNTLENLENLKNDMEILKNNKIKNLSEKEITLLFKALKQIQHSESKIERVSLLQEVENHKFRGNIKRNIEAYFSENLVYTAQNPKKPHEHLLGFTLGAGHSLLSLGESLFSLGKGIIQTPYHLTLLASGKAKTNSFKNI